MKAFPPFRLDAVNQCLWRDDARITVPPKVFAVLSYLVDHPGRLVTQNELLEAIWPDTYVQPEVLRKYILELRKLLGDRPKDPLFIETFPKRGYQFRAAVTDEGPVAPAPLARSSAPVPVGRQAEFDQLETYLAASVDGQRRIIWVTGEAGVGKTTLLDTFQQAARARGIRVARGQCVEGFGGQEAYYPVLEALGQLIREPGADPLVQVLASIAPTWLIQFPRVLKAAQREELQREILGATRERMVREICEALEVGTSQTPLVLILEDLHWVDISTLDLLSALARRRAEARLMLIGTYRPVDIILRKSPLKTLKQDLQVHRLCFEIPVERLTEKDVAAYLAGEFPGASSIPALANLIHRHSDGNPLFMATLAGELAERGILTNANRQWSLTKPVESIEMGVPETLQQMIELQLDQLSEDEQATLRAASVAGQRFSAWAVAQMRDLDVRQVEETLEKFAGRQQFLRPGRAASVLGSSVSGDYEFRHSLYREALYRRIPLMQRSLLHNSLALRAEDLLGPSIAREYASELALHFEQGRDPYNAARYLLWSARNAALKYAHREAITTLERALKLLSGAPSEAGRKLEIEVLEAISDAHYALGEMERSARIDERAAALAGERGLRAAQADALTRAARALSFLDPDDCVTVCERAVEVIAELGDPLLEARTQMLAACWRIINDGWTHKDADICVAAREKIRRLQGPGLPEYYEILYAHVQSLQGEYADSCAIADAGLAKATEIHSLVMYLSSLSSKALALIHLGTWGELRRVLEHGIDLARKNGNAPWAGIFESMLAWLYMQSCDFSAARALGETLLARHTEEPMGQTQMIALLTVAYCDLATGSPHKALEACGLVRDRQLKPKVFLQRYWRMISEFGIVGALLDLGDLEAAQTAAEIFVEEAGNTADPAQRSPAWDALARVAAAKGDLKRALDCSAKAIDEMRGFDLPSVAWRVHSTASWLHARVGAVDAAASYSQRATAALLLVANSFQKGDPLRQTLLVAADSLKAKLQDELEHSGVAGAGD